MAIKVLKIILTYSNRLFVSLLLDSRFNLIFIVLECVKSQFEKPYNNFNFCFIILNI
jgi:hypothetical protein